MTALTDITALAARLPFVMSDDEIREATGALEDLSDEARFYGSPRWELPTDAPYAVANLILKAAARHMKNYEGYTTSRAGDESVSWAEQREGAPGSASFTSDERDRLATLGNNPGNDFVSVGMWSWTRKRPYQQPGLVPDATSNEHIQMFSHETEPW